MQFPLVFHLIPLHENNVCYHPKKCTCHQFLGCHHPRCISCLHSNAFPLLRWHQIAVFSLIRWLPSLSSGCFSETSHSALLPLQMKTAERKKQPQSLCTPCVSLCMMCSHIPCTPHPHPSARTFAPNCC